MSQKNTSDLSGNDVGFGNKATINNQRTVNKDGSSNVRRIGLPFFRTADTYNALITMSWLKFSSIIVIGYISINAVFASIYLEIGTEHFNGINGTTTWEEFLDCFFFSAQTISTVGYGHISPKGTITSFVAAFESMLGLLAFALATGLLYGRFSRPMARLLYSNSMLVSPYGGGVGLMFRVMNYRRNQLIEVEAEVLLTMNAVDEQGKSNRKFYSLELERKKINILALSWTIVHPISAASPLFGFKQRDLEAADAEFIVFIKAFDDTFSQTVHSRNSYKHHEIIWSAKFKPVFYPAKDGVTVLDYSIIHDYDLV